MGSASILLAVRGILPRTERVSLRKLTSRPCARRPSGKLPYRAGKMPAIAIAIIASSEIYALAVEG